MDFNHNRQFTTTKNVQKECGVDTEMSLNSFNKFCVLEYVFVFWRPPGAFEHFSLNVHWAVCKPYI